MAAARAGCADDLKAFEELLDRDQGHAELLARVLQASACAVTAQEKINALGRVLADGLQGPDKLDEALLLAAALNDLERPHVQVLSATAKSGAPITRRSGASSGGGRDSRTPGAGPPCPSSPRRPAAISWCPARSQCSLGTGCWSSGPGTARASTACSETRSGPSRRLAQRAFNCWRSRSPRGSGTRWRTSRPEAWRRAPRAAHDLSAVTTARAVRL